MPTLEHSVELTNWVTMSSRADLTPAFPQAISVLLNHPPCKFKAVEMECGCASKITMAQFFPK